MVQTLGLDLPVYFLARDFGRIGDDGLLRAGIYGSRPQFPFG